MALSSKISVIIVDENKEDIKITKDLVRKSQLNLLGVFQDFKSVVSAINTLKPDVVIAEINFEKFSIFEVFQEIDFFDFGLILTTYAKDYAAEAFKKRALDYLIKPLKEYEFELAVLKYRRTVEFEKIKKEYQKINFSKSRITLPFGAHSEIVETDNIIYFEADTNYTYVHFNTSKPVLVSKTLGSFEGKFKYLSNFIRIHRSYLINLDHIKRIYKTQLPQIVMSNEDVLSVARSKKKDFLEVLTKI